MGARDILERLDPAEGGEGGPRLWGRVIDSQRMDPAECEARGPRSERARALLGFWGFQGAHY